MRSSATPAADRDRTERPRLLVVAPSTELYGADRVLLSILPALAHRYDVTITVPGSGPLAARIRALGIEVVELTDYAIRSRHLRPASVVPWLCRVGRSTGTLHQLHRSQPFDLIYSGSLASGLGSLLRLAWRLPHVQHVHEFPYHGTIRRQVLLRSVQLTASELVFNSEYIRRSTLRAVPAVADRSTVVHNGVDPSAWRQAHDDARPLRVVCAARINHWKGHAVLVEAARLARQHGSSWELHLFGDALAEDRHIARDLRRQVDAAGLTRSTTFHGFVEDQESIYRVADVLAVPSTRPEPFSMTALEAQARGIPVVATVPGGPAEIVVDGETGFLVAQSDAAALCRAVTRLEDTTLRRTMGAQAVLRAQTEFALQSMSARLIAIFDRQTSQRPRVPD